MEKWKHGWRLPQSGQPATCSAASGGRRSHARRTLRSPRRSCQGEGTEMSVGFVYLFWSSRVSTTTPTPPSPPVNRQNLPPWKCKWCFLLLQVWVGPRAPTAPSCHGDPGKLGGKEASWAPWESLPVSVVSLHPSEGGRPFQHPLPRAMVAEQVAKPWGIDERYSVRKYVTIQDILESVRLSVGLTVFFFF